MSYIRLLSYYEPRFPFPQGASAGAYPQFVGSPGLSGMGLYRPNQAFYRGITTGVSRQLSAVDPTAVNFTDPTTLLMLAGAGFILWNMFKGARSVKRTIRRRRRGTTARRSKPAREEFSEDYGIRPK
jgi:hypothetical protein